MARLQCWCVVALLAGLPGLPAQAAEPFTTGLFAQVAAGTDLADFLGLPERGPWSSVVPVSLRHAQILLEGAPIPYGAFSLRIAAVPAPALAEGHVAVGPEWLRLALGRIRAPLGAEFLAEDWDLPTLSRSEPLFHVLGGEAPISMATAFLADAARLTFSLGKATATAWASQADVATRLEFEPGPAMAGGLYYLASNPLLPEPRAAFPDGSTRPGFRDRWGADVRWREGPIAIAGEVHRGFEVTQGGGLAGLGFHVYGTIDLSDRQRLLLRFEQTDPDLIGGRDMSVYLLPVSKTVTLGWSLALPDERTRIRVELRRDSLPMRQDKNSALGALEVKL
ncbi:MAG: hypothetical protein FJZ01_12910 [Candidatus Sericytochromatia bacterium]|nr:hypothetical protein [Candidatus Tanganyikabacteria bacterium]